MKTKILLFALMGMLAFTSCEDEDEDVTPQATATATGNGNGSGNNNGGNSGGNNGGNLTSMPSSIMSLEKNKIFSNDTVMASFVNFRFQSDLIYFYQTDNPFDTQDNFQIAFEDSIKYIESGLQVYDYQTDGLSKKKGEWSFRFCANDGTRLCYATETDFPNWNVVLTTGKCYVDTQGDKVIFGFENIQIKGKSFNGRFELTNSVITDPNFDGSWTDGPLD